jgi:hypothetical protein
VKRINTRANSKVQNTNIYGDALSGAAVYQTLPEENMAEERTAATPDGSAAWDIPDDVQDQMEDAAFADASAYDMDCPEHHSLAARDFEERRDADAAPPR